MLGYSKEPSHWDGSFEHPEQNMFKLTVRKYLQFYFENFCLSKPVSKASFFYPIA